MKICVLGAAGSGTSTISSSIAKRYGWRKFESDYFAWEQTDPPFVRQRPDKESISLLLTEITKYDDLIVAGNVAKWGDVFFDKFDLVIFLYAPTDVRLERLKHREHELYGDRVSEGGDMYQRFIEFLGYAERYDEGDENFRSLLLHNKFLSKVTCPVMRVNTDDVLQNIMENIFAQIDKMLEQSQ